MAFAGLLHHACESNANAEWVNDMQHPAAGNRQARLKARLNGCMGNKTLVSRSKGCWFQS